MWEEKVQLDYVGAASNRIHQELDALPSRHFLHRIASLIILNSKLLLTSIFPVPFWLFPWASSRSLNEMVFVGFFVFIHLLPVVIS